MTKFCRDCHWARDKYASAQDWKCRSPQNTILNSDNTQMISRVTGEFVAWMKSCDEARNRVSHLNPSCGPEAIWFQTTKEALPPRILEPTNTKLSKISLGDL